ncbi:MAG: twin-arginine translocase subunit TatC [Deinococcota bacterium]|jgi:sec-independent protein translocase protein TatC|nr:twin-arginine translocase subunit TatC [Deinococcota bacterium]
MTLLDHLEELRNRLFIAIAAWVVGTGIAFVFRFDLLAWLQQPLPANLTLNFFGLLEPFIASMQIAAFFGLVLASPVIGAQVWGFISPGLYDEERRWSVPFIFLTAVAFALGVVFARYVVLPVAVPILLGFLGDQVGAVLSIGDYISKVIMYMALFGILFEMPILSFLLARLGLLRARFLIHYRKTAIIIGLVAAAGLSPTGDPFNFALLAIPIVLLYELSIVIVRLSQKRDHGREDTELTQPH